MKILLVSHRFPPDIGGIERMSELLARGFVARGHEVRVVTGSANPPAPGDFPFEVLYSPRPLELWRAHRWSDLVFHNNICLTFLWPLTAVRRPMVAAVRTWVTRADGSVGPRDRLKRAILSRVPTIAISRAVADDLAGASTVIPNAYRDDLFFTEVPAERRQRDFVVVARLVSDKGVDLAVEAIGRLVAEGRQTDLTIVGDGPERPALEAQVERLGLASRVTFAGPADAVGVRAAFNAHRFALVPSRWKEPFGVVALEALACGAVPIVTAGGGLGEAVGDAGIVVPNDDADALASAARDLLAEPARVDALRAAAPAVVAAHHPDVMIDAYAAVLERAAGIAPAPALP